MCDPITVARVGLDRDEPVAAGGRALRTWAAVRPGRNIGARSPTATRRRDGRRSNCAEWRYLDEGAGDSAIPRARRDARGGQVVFLSHRLLHENTRYADPPPEVPAMPPHCDSLNGPVVSAARQALATADVGRVLPFVPEEAEAEVQAMFRRVLPVRALGPEAAEVADRLFFETVVRLHRTGEGAAFSGLKPAGLPHGPALPLAEAAVATGSADALADFLAGVLREELEQRLASVVELAASKDRSVADARRYVEAMLGFEVHSHHLLGAMQAASHDEHAGSRGSQG